MSKKAEVGLDNVESRLKGNTLRLYWYMVKVARPVTINEARKSLKLSSPGLAAYHLDKLRELGLVEKTSQGEYRIVEEVKVGVLRSFVRLYSFMVPIYVFYAVFFTALLIIFLVFFMNLLLIQSWFAILVCSIAAAIFWYEAIKAWRGRPF